MARRGSKEFWKEAAEAARADLLLASSEVERLAAEVARLRPAEAARPKAQAIDLSLVERSLHAGVDSVMKEVAGVVGCEPLALLGVMALQMSHDRAQYRAQTIVGRMRHIRGSKL